MENVPISIIPDDILLYILSFTQSWDLVNVPHVSKKWHNVLKPTFFELREIYQTLLGCEAGTIIEQCSKSIKHTKVVLMANKLLTQLTLDQIVKISSNSLEHTEILLQSKLFQDRPIHKVKPQQKIESKTVDEDWLGSIPVQTNKGWESVSFSLSDMREAMESFSSDFHADIFDHFFPFLTDLYSEIEKLSRKDLLAEESEQLHQEALSESSHQHFKYYPRTYEGKHHEITSKYLCQSYIARALAADNAQTIPLIATYAKQTLKVRRIITLACISLNHTKFILSTPALLHKLKAKTLSEISKISEEHSKIVLTHSLNLVTDLPIKFVKVKFDATKAVAMLIIKDTFFQSSNPVWKNWLEKKPEIAAHILEIRKCYKVDAFIHYTLIKIADISAKHASEVLSIKGIKKFLPETMLDKLAQKNQEYAELIRDFRENNQVTNFNSTRKFFS